MSDRSAHSPATGATPSRARLHAVIPRRAKVGPLTAFVLATGFALAVTPILRIDLWLAQSGSLDMVPGEPAPVTVRVPPFVDPAPADGAGRTGGGAIVIARGDVVTPTDAALVARVRARTPHGLFGDLAYFAVVLALTAIYTLQLRRSNRGRFLRTQVVLLGVLVVVAGVVKALMLTTALSVLAVPVALIALATAMAVDREAGVATGVLASVVVGLLVPFDIGVTVILLVQALTASLLLPDRIRRRWRVALWAGVAAALTGALAYGIVHYLTRGTAPVDELGRIDASSWLAAAVGGLCAAFLAVPAVPLLQILTGEITDGHLISLEDLSHPLLRQISEKAPGTWQHSLAMANMAEIAANAIGANGRLVRVGAYFHDLGKSLQPKYFIENVDSGEQSPHDRLPPEVSCDAIFAHVTEGIALARRSRLPERVIDFMHMHHGDGVLEYFWAKAQEQGNPNHLSTEDFRYPGVPPQSRETAILAICDAVEAASRTLRRPDAQAIGNLVQRIVYGKLHLGQLDESGLSMADLRKISDSLRETIKHAHHGRIEYPWQRAERAEREAEERDTAPERPTRGRESITARILDEPRLDSLDAPRPPWAAGATHPRAMTSDGNAATVPVGTPPPMPPSSSSPSLTLPLRPTAPAQAVDIASAMDVAPPLDVALAPTAQVSVPEAEIRIAHDPVPVPVPMPDPPRWSGTFAAAAEDALVSVTAPHPARATTSTPWGAQLADRIDALVDQADEDASHAAPPAPPAPQLEILDDSAPVPEPAEPAVTARRHPPPPPPPRPHDDELTSPRHRRPKSTVELIGEDDVEATIELSPTMRSAAVDGPIVGPPPATRPAPSAPAPARADSVDDDAVTVVPRPPSSMLPPRARTHGKPRE